MKTHLECVVCGRRIPTRDILLGRGRKIDPGRCVCEACSSAASPSGDSSDPSVSSGASPARSFSLTSTKRRTPVGSATVLRLLAAVLLLAVGASLWWWLDPSAPSPESSPPVEPQPAAPTADAQQVRPPVEPRPGARSGDAGGPLGPLSPEEVARLKAATVYVRAPNSVGTGFLFRRRDGGPILIATNHHVIASGPRVAERVQVVLDSGTERQRAFPARMVAISPGDDLAVLRLENPPTEVRYLELSGDEVFETQPVRVVGFPFGELLERRVSSPSPTLATGTVSSLRYDGQGLLERVQLDADINPGNSGGPVVDRQGRVVGIAVETVLATNISFMIPVETLQRVLDGFISDFRHEVDGQTLRVHLFVEDPLDRITEVGLNAFPPDREPPESAKRWPFPVGGERLVSEAPDGRDHVLEIRLSRYRDREVWIQPWFRRAGDAQGLAPFRVDLRAGIGAAASDPQVGGGDSARTGELRPSRPRDSGWLGGGSKAAGLLQRKPQVTRASLGGIEQRFRGMRYREVLEVGSEVVDLAWSPDGRHVYLLQKDGTLRKVDARSLREERKLALEAAASSVSWSDAGLVVGLPALRQVLLVSARSLEPLEAIRVPDASTVVSASGLEVAFTLPTQGSTMTLIDLERGETIGAFELANLADPKVCESSWLEPGAHRPHEISAVETPTGGEYLLLSTGGVLYRFRIEGSRLVCEEAGPQLGSPLSGGQASITVSPDGLYTANPTVHGNRNLAGGRKDSDTLHIFQVENLREPVLTVRSGGLKRLGFEMDRGWIFTRERNQGLRIVSAGGLELETYTVLEGRDTLEAVEGSPRSGVIFLLTSERLIWARFD